MAFLLEVGARPSNGGLTLADTGLPFSTSPFDATPLLPPSLLHLALLAQGRVVGGESEGVRERLLKILLPLLGDELELTDENGVRRSHLAGVVCYRDSSLPAGHTPLMLAASRGDTPAVTLLLDNGADIHCRVGC